MHKLSRFLFALSLMLACSFITAAQEKSQANSIPKVLQITREYTKPYRAGMVHNASESAFVRAMANAKWPTHYLGMTSLSGKQRALFLTSYASLEAWEKDGAAVEKNPTLSAAVEAAGVADGAELESVDQGVFVFNEEMSLRPMADLSQMRFMEVSIYHVRPGHERNGVKRSRSSKPRTRREYPARTGACSTRSTAAKAARIWCSPHARRSPKSIAASRWKTSNSKRPSAQTA